MDRSEAATSEVFMVVLEAGEAPPRHVHHEMEQIFYVLDGSGTLTVGDPPTRHPVAPGDVVRIPPHAYHSIICTGSRPLRYLSVDAFVGGKPAAEPTWESHVRVLCETFGWDFDRIKGEVRR
jgi:quercetin dioxygenase-like cupin family protein